MQGKLCLVTGGTAGIGLCTATGLAKQGAHLILIGRDRQRGQAAVAQIEQATGNAAQFVSVDLSDQSALHDFASWYRATFSRLDVLINNAGVMLGRRQLSVDKVEMTFAVNHLAYFLMTLLLMPSLRAAEHARIINVASDAHFGAKLDFDDLQNERRYSGWRAYKRSKLCNLLFTYELARRLSTRSITSNAMHPGFVASRIGTRHGWTFDAVWKLLTLFAATPERGAETCVHLACSPGLAEISGRYFFRCHPKDSSPASRDLDAARRLWEVSAALTQTDDIRLG